MALEPAYGVSTGSIADGAVTAAKLADPGGMPVGRRGAKCSSAGAIVYSAPYLDAAYSFSGKATYAGSGLQTLCGRRAAGNFELRVSATGELELNHNGTTRARSAAGVVPQDGSSFAWEMQVSSSGLVGLIDGAVVVTSTTAETLTVVGGASTWIGRAFTADPGYWQGVIWDFKHEYASSTANSAYFPLDGKNSSGAYPNVWAVGASQDQGSTVANATVTGFVEDVLINSTSPGGGGAVRTIWDQISQLPSEDIAGNLTDTPFAVQNNADRDMRIRIKAGSTAQYRAYLDWRDENDANVWLNGVNRDNVYILYDREAPAHRIEMSSGGGTTISSAGSDAVNINNSQDQGSGTGGLRVYQGGTNQNKLIAEFRMEGTLLSGSSAAVHTTFRNNDTDDTAQSIRIGARHYDAQAAPAALLSASCQAAANRLDIGGGTGAMNAMNTVRINCGTGVTGGGGTPVGIWSTRGLKIAPAGTGLVEASGQACLELESTTKGFLPPRMTTTQRDAIATPPEGLMIWNTTTKAIETYNGTAWA